MLGARLGYKPKAGKGAKSSNPSGQEHAEKTWAFGGEPITPDQQRPYTSKDGVLAVNQAASV